MTIDLVISRIQHGEIELDPSFQRADVWTAKAQSKLIESILLRIPLPAFYMGAIDEEKWVVEVSFQILQLLFDGFDFLFIGWLSFFRYG
jgi:uncharacterized protein with ParB-like and HNH nuclease domain